MIASIFCHHLTRKCRVAHECSFWRCCSAARLSGVDRSSGPFLSCQNFCACEDNARNHVCNGLLAAIRCAVHEGPVRCRFLGRLSGRLSNAHRCLASEKRSSGKSRGGFGRVSWVYGDLRRASAFDLAGQDVFAGSCAQIHHGFCRFVGGMRCFPTVLTPFAPRFYGFAQV